MLDTCCIIISSFPNINCLTLFSMLRNTTLDSSGWRTLDLGAKFFLIFLYKSFVLGNLTFVFLKSVILQYTMRSRHGIRTVVRFLRVSVDIPAIWILKQVILTFVFGYKDLTLRCRKWRPFSLNILKQSSTTTDGNCANSELSYCSEQSKDGFTASRRLNGSDRREHESQIYWKLDVSESQPSYV